MQLFHSAVLLQYYSSLSDTCSLAHACMALHLAQNISMLNLSQEKLNVIDQPPGKILVTLVLYILVK